MFTFLVICMYHTCNNNIIMQYSHHARTSQSALITIFTHNYVCLYLVYGVVYATYINIFLQLFLGRHNIISGTATNVTKLRVYSVKMVTMMTQQMSNQNSFLDASTIITRADTEFRFK